jgi:hypothetical protein
VLVSSTQQGKVVDVDTLLSKEKTNIYVLHNQFMVYIVTFSSDVCRPIYPVAAKKTYVLVQFDQEILQGIKAIRNLDKCRCLRMLYTLPMLALPSGRNDQCSTPSQNIAEKSLWGKCWNWCRTSNKIFLK